MTRVIEDEITIELAAAEFWQLRLDSGFDSFCAAAVRCTFQLFSMREAHDAQVNLHLH
jgi:hypothetical protein